MCLSAVMDCKIFTFFELLISFLFHLITLTSHIPDINCKTEANCIYFRPVREILFKHTCTATYSGVGGLFFCLNLPSSSSILGVCR